MATKDSKKMSADEVAADKARRVMEGVAIWTSFYRANPHRFAKDYLNISNLKIFQKILLYMMNISTHFMFLAARGLGKSYLTAIFCVIRCILYPETKICVASKNRNQGNIVLEKIMNEILIKAPNLKAEIESSVLSLNRAEIIFKNGSWIRVVVASDNARGARANIMVIDEFRMVDLNVINAVLKKFLSAERIPAFLEKPEYSKNKDKYAERNKEIYMSSCWFKSHWSFDKAKAFSANLVNESKKYFICGLPYQLSIREGLLSKDQVADEMSEADFNALSWEIEMQTVWYGDKDGSFFSYDDISKNRRLKKCIYPDNISNAINPKDFKIPELSRNEKRIISVDVALLAGKNNDASSIFINSCIPTSSQKYVGNLIYTENHEGLTTDDLALIVRRLYEQFHCTDIALDVNGIGTGVFDALIRDIYDPLTNETYSALNCINNKDYATRCKELDAPKVIWAIKATQAFNTAIYLSLREAFKQNKINLLIHEFDAEEILGSIRGYKNMDMSFKTKLVLPYIHTTLLVNELINLEYKTDGTNVKVFEKAGMRKDRVSSVAYNYYVQSQLELKLRKPRGDDLIKEVFHFRKPKIYREGR